MIRSLRWRLQLWHALLLTTVLIIFGGVVYALQWQTRLQQTDAELDMMASVLTSRLRGLFPIPRIPAPGPRPRPAGRSPGDDAPADALNPENTGRRDTRPPRRDSAETPSRSSQADSAPPDRGRDSAPSDRGRETGPDRDRPRDLSRNPWFAPPPGLGLPDEFKHLFEGNRPGTFYFAIWDRSGTLLEKSASIGDVSFPDLHTAEDGLPVRRVFQRGYQRDVVHVSRFDINVLVGRSILPDLAAQHLSAVRMIFTGLGVLVIGLAGGWWFSSRAIRPIREITAIAQSISVKNLSTRINIQSTATELEQLASVLNHTFDRLQSAFERQGQFTADASHELRTPLSVILSQAELALSRPRSPEDYQKAFQACRRASLRMKSLIDSLLILARFDARNTDLHRQSVDLSQMVQETIDMLQPLADERQVALKNRCAQVILEADPEQIYQLLTNLLTNAIRYNKPGGSVDVQTQCDRQSVRLKVIDTGVGIPAEDLPRIFNRFYRVDKARSHPEGGCGLGLAICRNIAEAHGGAIRAISTPGEGTTIEVDLPLQICATPLFEPAPDSEACLAISRH